MTSDDGVRSSEDSRAADTASSASPIVPSLPAASSPPPYWLNPPAGHQRTASNASAESMPAPGGITMLDNDGDDRNEACWARSVEITDYVVVNSSATNIGAFVVYNIRVETLSVRAWAVELVLRLLARTDKTQGSHMNIRKRYSEFDDFRNRLIYTFPRFEAAVPALPPKSVLFKYRPGSRFLEKRRAGLQYFLK
jgi:hypothetical protein